MPLESLELIWLYAQMSEKDQGMFREFIQESLKRDGLHPDETEVSQVLRNSGTEVSTNLLEYTDLMGKLVGTLIAQACELAAIVYRYYCIDKKSVKEISKALHVPEDSVSLIARYYERKRK